MDQHIFNSSEIKPKNRPSLIRDVANSHFNLDVRLGKSEIETTFADIRVNKGVLATHLQVNTSWSEVERSKAQARRSDNGNLMIYLIQRGGSWFQNESGQEFRTHRGSVVVGSQASVYRAVAAEGQSWGFQALSIAPGQLLHSANVIRQSGFRMVPDGCAMQPILSAYLRNFFDQFNGLSTPECLASLRALDHLLKASLFHGETASDAAHDVISQQRFKGAMQFIQSNLLNQRLSSALVAQHVCISERQLQRVFASQSTSVANEIGKLRLELALDLLQTSTLPVTEIAFKTGYDSLSTFYRSIKKSKGCTATDIRHQAVDI